MGIMAAIARVVLREHLYRPITGEGLLIGRQTVPLSVAEARTVLAEEGVAERPGIDLSAPGIVDTDTRSAVGKGYITDRGFFGLFSDVRLQTLDVTDYEGADIIHDMHQPVPESLHGRFDFVWNGSCLDNMFDPAMAMRSTARMLKPGGRMICMEMATPHFDAYVAFSQGWFLDYCAINRFADCKVYTVSVSPKTLLRGAYHLFRAKDPDAGSRQFPQGLFRRSWFGDMARLTVTIAESDAGTTWDRMPIQSQYRPEDPTYARSHARFAASDRPVMRFGRTAASRLVRASRKAEYLGVIPGAPG